MVHLECLNDDVKDLLNEIVVDRAKSVKDDVVEYVEIDVNDNVRDEDEGNDDIVEDVALLDVSDVEMDVELVDGDVDVKDEVVGDKAIKDKGDVVAVDDLVYDDVEINVDVLLGGVVNDDVQSRCYARSQCA